MRKRISIGATALVGALLATSACSQATTTGQSPSATPPEASARVAVGYEGGVAVLDASTLSVVGSFPSEEFIRLNSAGDGRHVMVSTSAGFQLLDTSTPALTNLVVPAKAPGHVVRHAGTTVLFDDGTGKTTVFDSTELAAATDALPAAATYQADDPHHGVSIALQDGTLLTTIGDEGGRSGALALAPHGDHWHSHSSSEDCPGIHGEGTAAHEAVVFGCEDGALLYTDGKFTKLKARHAYGRMGNAYVSETSPLVVGDYNSDPDAEGYLLDQVTLIDTQAKTLKVVALPSGVRYTWRDIARGPDDLAYILSTDGSIHVLDPESGEIERSFPVIDSWEGPSQWQDPHPAIAIDGDTAYVTEPAASSLHAVDLTTGKVTATQQLTQAPNEIAITAAS